MSKINMTKDELLEKLETFADLSNEIVGLAEDIRDFADDFYYYIAMMRRELKDDDNER